MWSILTSAVRRLLFVVLAEVVVLVSLILSIQLNTMASQVSSLQKVVFWFYWSHKAGNMVYLKTLLWEPEISLTNHTAEVGKHRKPPAKVCVNFRFNSCNVFTCNRQCLTKFKPNRNPSRISAIRYPVVTPATDKVLISWQARITKWPYELKVLKRPCNLMAPAINHLFLFT